MTKTKVAVHRAVDRLEDAEAEAMLEMICAKRVNAFLANVEEIEPGEWDSEILAGIAEEDRDPAAWSSSDEVNTRLKILHRKSP